MALFRALVVCLCSATVGVLGCGSSDSTDGGGGERSEPQPSTPKAAGDPAASSAPPAGSGAPPAGSGAPIPGTEGETRAQLCQRFGAHVATCYGSSQVDYVGWCSHFLKSCPDSHIESCVNSACSDVKARCGFC